MHMYLKVVYIEKVALSRCFSVIFTIHSVSYSALLGGGEEGGMLPSPPLPSPPFTVGWKVLDSDFPHCTSAAWMINNEKVKITFLKWEQNAFSEPE